MRILGLDVGSRWIKGTVLKRGMLSQTCLHAFRRQVAATPLPEQIAAILAEEAPGIDLLVMSVPRDQVVTRNVSLPFKDLRKVKAVVPGVAEQNLPFPLRDAVVRHLVTDETAPGATHILLLVMNRKELEPALAVLTAQRVPEFTVSIDSIGVANAVLSELPDASGIICVDVGARKTSIEVLNRGKLVFSRALGIAGDNFTATIAAKLKVPAEEAEQLKCALAGEPDATETARAQGVRAALADAYKRLGRELKLSVLAARNLWPSMEISGIRLTGGSARAPGLVEAIADATGVTTTVYSARILAGKPQAADPAMVGSVGLALTGVRKARIEVDFLSRPRDIVRFHRKEIALTLVILVIGLLGSWISARRDVAQLRTEDEVADREIGGGFGRISQLSRQQVNKGNLDATATRLRKMQQLMSEDSASRLFLVNEIAKALPDREDISFRSLVFDKGAAELEGETDSFETVQKLEEALKKGLQRNIEVQPPRNEMRDDRTITIFRLKFPAETQEGKR